MKKKYKKLNTFFCFSFLFFFAIIVTSLIFYQSKKVETELINLNFVNFKIEKKPPTTNLYFVGDIMLTRGVESSVKKNWDGDYNQLFKNLEELKKADILFGNLEGPISDQGNNVGSKYSFRMSPNVLPALKNAGFDIFSFANNHVGDWNITAFKDTLSRLTEFDILKTGAGLNKKEATEPTIIYKNGTSFGFLGFSDVGPNWMEAKENSPGILLASDPDFENIIKQANKKVDVLIVSFHWGEEYKTIHNSRQENLAHQAIDAGASLIIGHHPHVIQDIQYYKDKPIVYSLGNFIFDQHFSKDTMKGLLFIATFEGKELKKTKTLTNLLNKNYQSEGLFEKEALEDKEEVLSSNCPKPKEEYENMFFLNIGQKINLENKEYIPANLVSLGDLSIPKNLCLVQEAKKALIQMLKDAEQVGLEIKVVSAYRSYSYQENLLARALKTKGQESLSFIAKAGHSEHQLGTAVDLSGSSINFSSAFSSFDNTPEDFWLRENAHKYGFVMSYPFGKEKITGYPYEPWHYRYLGVEKASQIKNSGLTITEFLQ